jgi:hypothetical protein
MTKKFDLYNLIAGGIIGFIAGVILGAGTMMIYHGERLAKLEAQTEQAKNKSAENSTKENVSKATGDSQPQKSNDSQLAGHARLTKEAWDAFNRKNYEAAIIKAKECTDSLGVQALQEQKDLTADNLPPPPKKPADDKEKETILSRGLINDVATCYFIQGQAYEMSGKVAEAKEAYENAKKFPHARTWDTAGGFFWSPAEGASARLSILL